jgi:hypothetical protein
MDTHAQYGFLDGYISKDAGYQDLLRNVENNPMQGAAFSGLGGAALGGLAGGLIGGRDAAIPGALIGALALAVSDLAGLGLDEAIRSILKMFSKGESPGPEVQQKAEELMQADPELVQQAAEHPFVTSNEAHAAVENAPAEIKEQGRVLIANAHVLPTMHARVQGAKMGPNQPDPAAQVATPSVPASPAAVPPGAPDAYGDLGIDPQGESTTQDPLVAASQDRVGDLPVGDQQTLNTLRNPLAMRAAQTNAAAQAAQQNQQFQAAARQQTPEAKAMRAKRLAQLQALKGKQDQGGLNVGSRLGNVLSDAGSVITGTGRQIGQAASDIGRSATETASDLKSRAGAVADAAKEQVTSGVRTVADSALSGLEGAVGGAKEHVNQAAPVAPAPQVPTPAPPAAPAAEPPAVDLDNW